MLGERCGHGQSLTHCLFRECPSFATHLVGQRRMAFQAWMTRCGPVSLPHPVAYYPSCSPPRLISTSDFALSYVTRFSCARRSNTTRAFINDSELKSKLEVTYANLSLFSAKFSSTRKQRGTGVRFEWRFERRSAVCSIPIRDNYDARCSMRSCRLLFWHLQRMFRSSD